MTASERTGKPGAAPSAEFDVAVVFVHGIGRQQRGETLLEWCEPITRRLDYLSRHGGGDGATITRAEVVPALEGESRVELAVSSTAGSQRIILTEARWSQAFLPPSPSELPGWVGRNAFKAGGRLASMLFHHTLDSRNRAWQRLIRPAPLVHRSKESGTLQVTPFLPQSSAALVVESLVLYLAAAFSLVLTIVGFFALIVVGWVIPAVGIVLTLFLVIFARLPVVNRWVQPVVFLLADFIGDATVWTDQPVRAEAMMGIVRSAVATANDRATRTIVVAHSQGAAVSSRALFSSPHLLVDHLVTVGGAVDLLHDSGWRGSRASTPDIIGKWLSTDIDWTNIWAGLDPVPAGPVGPRGRGSWRAASRRWSAVASLSHRLSRSWLSVAKKHFANPQRYSFQLANLALAASLMAGRRPIYDPGESRREGLELASRADAEIGELLPDAFQAILEKHRIPAGPQEYRVQNFDSLTADHTTYAKNVAQVVDPIVRSIILRDVLGDPADVRDLSRRRGLAVRLRGMNGLFSLILAAALAPIVLSIVPWISTPDGAQELATGSALWTYVLSAIEDFDLWSLLVLSVVALVIYVVLASISRSLWNVWVEDFTWSRDRKPRASAIRYCMPFAIVTSIISALGGFLGLRAALNIFNEWLQPLPALRWFPPVVLEPGAAGIYTAIALGVVTWGVFHSAEYPPLPQVRPVTDPNLSSPRYQASRVDSLEPFVIVKKYEEHNFGRE